jgi:purine-binding chemotaxis protein CheW
MAETCAVRDELKPSTPLTLLVFEVCGELCGLVVAHVEEIVPMAALAQLPGQPPVLAGFLNLRGSAIPVLRLNRLFSLPSQGPGLHTPLVVLRAGTALLVDSVLDIVTAANDGLLPLAAGNCFGECALAQFPFDGRTAHLLSAERLLLEKERQCVAELRAQAQQFLSELEPCK